MGLLPRLTENICLQHTGFRTSLASNFSNFYPPKEVVFLFIYRYLLRHFQLDNLGQSMTLSFHKVGFFCPCESIKKHDQLCDRSQGRQPKVCSIYPRPNHVPIDMTGYQSLLGRLMRTSPPQKPTTPPLSSADNGSGVAGPLRTNRGCETGCTSNIADAGKRVGCCLLSATLRGIQGVASRDLLRCGGT